MTGLILAASILASVPGAVEATFQDPPVTKQEFDALKARVALQEHINREMWSCHSRAMLGAGADLLSTAFALNQQGDKVQEGNPLGFNTEARVALKLSQVGATVASCYLLNKDGHHKASDIASWSSLGIQLLATLNNLLRGFGVIGGK